jgi:hypothetical protein
MLIIVLFLKKTDMEDEQADDWKNIIANPLRRAEPIRGMRFGFIISFATSQGGVKGTSSVN